jgi:hypothetical protein
MEIIQKEYAEPGRYGDFGEFLPVLLTELGTRYPPR